jgi:hypothetical protein
MIFDVRKCLKEKPAQKGTRLTLLISHVGYFFNSNKRNFIHGKGHQVHMILTDALHYVIYESYMHNIKIFILCMRMTRTCMIKLDLSLADFWVQT